MRPLLAFVAGTLLFWYVLHRVNVSIWKASGEQDLRGKPSFRQAWTW